MSKLFNYFAKHEDGAVTVDWVVLTAAIVLMAALIGNGIRDETTDLGNRVAGQIAAMEP